MTRAEEIGVIVPEILLPDPSIDLQKWAVIACDQFTSQPEYWEKVAHFVGDAPSTFHMILPEVWLHSPDIQDRIRASQQAMWDYLTSGILHPQRGFVLVERTVHGEVQTGLVVALDLEDYDYHPGAQTLIRATEGTILDRLPPRMAVRRGAPLELPHILVLYDDPDQIVLSQVVAQKQQLAPLYDFELMEGSGHLKGWLVSDPQLTSSVTYNLTSLIEPENYTRKYGLQDSDHPLLFAMGDGNHSLATAKAIWEELKPQAEPQHPARFALVELVNLHDPSLHFEAIHRVLFNVPEGFCDQCVQHLGEGVYLKPAGSFKEMAEAVAQPPAGVQRLGVLNADGVSLLEIPHPTQQLAVGSLQRYLDEYLQQNPSVKIDYVHGEEVLTQLSQQDHNIGFYLPAIPKESFFKTVILDGALPRKTFSMGHAKDKRFYMECRRIVP